MLRQAGFTLTELMVGMTLGLIVLAGALRLYQSNLIATTTTLKTNRLTHELQQLLDLMATDLRRSGYRGGDPARAHSLDNPFMAVPHTLRTGRYPGEANDSCVLYSYDSNHDKAVGVGSMPSSQPGTNQASMELFGFRLNRERLQMRNGGSVYACDTGSWQTLTSTDTVVTELTFDLRQTCLNIDRPGTPCRRGEAARLIRHIGIRLTGKLDSDPGIRAETRTQVLVRNDRMMRRW